jgi:hypothetical protein
VLGCDAPYAPAQTTELAATRAADAWAAGTTYPATVCGTFCLGRQTENQCAIWCYGISPLAGHVSLNTISNACVLCPTVTSPTWN